jgi:hypothetical protein
VQYNQPHFALFIPSVLTAVCIHNSNQRTFHTVLLLPVGASFAPTSDSFTPYYVEIKRQLDARDEFLLQILVLAQHVSGTIMPIIRSSRVLYKWLLPVVFSAWFSSCRYGVELRVVCPVCGLPLYCLCFVACSNTSQTTAHITTDHTAITASYSCAICYI